MMYYTHLAFAFFLLLISSYILFIENIVLFFIVGIFFSLLPDIDETKSKFGRKLFPLSFVIKIVFGHRTVLHSFYIPVLLFFVGYFLFSWEIGVAVFIGYMSHLFLDMSTRSGIMPLYPLSKVKVSGFFRTNSFTEKIIFILLVVGSTIVILS